MKIYEILAESGVLDVVKDNDLQTTLVDKASGITTVVDKKNPKAPKIEKAADGATTLSVPTPGATKPLPIPPGTKVNIKPQG
jgi:hypothetical protein